MVDIITANSQVKSLSETGRLNMRTKLLNPKLYKGVRSACYEGVRDIQKQLRNTMGWSAVVGVADTFVFEEANATFWG